MRTGLNRFLAPRPSPLSVPADSGPRERKKLQLKPRSVPVEAPAKEAAAAAAPAAPAPAKASAAIFGGARPVDTAAREREIEERLAKQREEEERKQIMSREPFVDRYVHAPSRVRVEAGVSRGSRLEGRPYVTVRLLMR